MNSEESKNVVDYKFHKTDCFPERWSNEAFTDRLVMELQVACDKIAELTAQLEAVGAGGVGPLIAKQARCKNCDDTGDVHSFDGEWRGSCHCPAGSTTPIPAGHVLVPIEPTREMTSALFWAKSTKEGYAAMIAARPQQKA